jgi:RHS repeat-associated protein
MTTNRIASVNGTSFSYDASGNVTGDGVRPYTYDAEKRLVSVGGPSSESYGYDAENHRVKKVVGGVVTHCVYEGNDMIAEYEMGGGATPAKGTRYYHPDHLSTRFITNGAGAVVGTTDHLPFGEEIGVSGEEGKHKFTTYERDATGLHYAVNRHYAPQQGRFNQVDPLGMGGASLADPQSLNLYSYVQNNPVNFTDPSGLLKYIGPPKGGGGGGIIIIIFIFPWFSPNIRIPNDGPRGGGQGGGPVQLPNISNPKITAPVKPPPIPKNPPKFNFDGNCGVNPLTGDPGFTEGKWGSAVGGYAKGDNGDPTFEGNRTGRQGNYDHGALDMHAGNDGRDAVLANKAGTVRRAGVGSGRAGNRIIIEHDGGLETRYLHLAAIFVQEGQAVAEGEMIASSGVSGRPANVSDPHLHFEVRLDGKKIDPVGHLNSSCPPPPPPR